MYIEVPAEQPHNGVVEPSPLVYITPTYVSWDIMCTRLDDVLHDVFTTCLLVHYLFTPPALGFLFHNTADAALTSPNISHMAIGISTPPIFYV